MESGTTPNPFGDPVRETASPPAGETWSVPDPRWWLARAQIVYGPYSVGELRRFAGTGRLGSGDQFRAENDLTWRPWSSLAAELGLPAAADATTTPAAPPLSPLVPPLESKERDTALEFMVPVNRHPLAIAAGYAGLFGLLVPLLSPIAVVLGILALRRIRPGQLGAVRAWVGIVLGVLGTGCLAMIAITVWGRLAL